MEAVNIEAALKGVRFLRGRRPESDTSGAFAELGRLGEAGIFAGGFAGESAWERHRSGDELVHVLGGAATLTILDPGGEEILEMGAGTLAVVPRGRWHRFHAPEGVTLMTVTPPPTDHSLAADPREEG